MSSPFMVLPPVLNKQRFDRWTMWWNSSLWRRDLLPGPERLSMKHKDLNPKKESLSYVKEFLCQPGTVIPESVT